MAKMIRELPPDQRPLDKAHRFGIEALSDIELVALLAGNQTLERGVAILAASGGLSDLRSMSIEDLEQVEGVGRANAVKLLAALELGRRATPGTDNAPQIRRPSDAADVLMAAYGHYKQEHLVVLSLDTKNRIRGQDVIYCGAVNTSLIRIAEIFRPAVRRMCPSIVVGHNHPSGDPTPSPEDASVTRQIVEAGKLMDIDVLDHIVFSEHRFISMKERGLGFVR